MHVGVTEIGPAQWIAVGEELTATSTIESIRSKAGSELLVVATDVRDTEDRAVVAARCTLVVRSPTAGAAT